MLSFRACVSVVSDSYIYAVHQYFYYTYSNPPVQEQVLEYGSLSLLCRLLSLSEPEIVQRRALFALSALLRGNIREQVNFIKHHHGLDILGKSFRERSPQMQLKAAVLLTDFLNNEVLHACLGFIIVMTNF